MKKRSPKRIVQFMYGLDNNNGDTVFKYRVKTDNNLWDNWHLVNESDILNVVNTEVNKILDGTSPEKIQNIRNIITWIEEHGPNSSEIITQIQNNQEQINIEKQRALEVEEDIINRIKGISYNSNAKTDPFVYLFAGTAKDLKLLLGSTTDSGRYRINFGDTIHIDLNVWKKNNGNVIQCIKGFTDLYEDTIDVSEEYNVFLRKGTLSNGVLDWDNWVCVEGSNIQIKLETEINRAKEAEQNNAQDIIANMNAINNEVTRATNTEVELDARIQGKSDNSDAVKDPFKFIGNYDNFEALIDKLDTMHGSVANTAKQYNGHFRAMVGTKLVEIFNEVQGYETDVWSQRITCVGIVLRNEVLRTEERYSQYSNETAHKYRQHRYVQKFVNSVGGGDNFDKKGGVKTFCRRHYLTGNNVSTWTPWYDVENPYVQSQNYGKRIAIFGGSFAQNMAANSADYQFTHEGTSYNLVDYIAEKLGATAFDDYAVGGQGMRSDVDSPFPVHINRQLQTSMEKNGIYDIYIIMGGVNDYWRGDVPLGDSDGYSAISENATEEQKKSYCGGMRQAVDYIRQMAPEAKGYTITPFKGYNLNEFWNARSTNRNALGNSFYEFVQAQKEVAQVVSVPCLDLWVQQGFSGANAYLNYLSDLLHPNGNGYYKVSEKILEFFAHGIGNEVVDVQALAFPKIAAETSRAEQAEKELADKITAEIQRAKQAEQANADAINAEKERAEAMEQQLQEWMDADKQENIEADKNIRENAMQYNTLGVNVYADKAEIYGRSINTTPHTFEFPAATTERAGVMSAEDKKKLDMLSIKVNELLSLI